MSVGLIALAGIPAINIPFSSIDLLTAALAAITELSAINIAPNIFAPGPM